MGSYFWSSAIFNIVLLFMTIIYNDTAIRLSRQQLFISYWATPVYQGENPFSATLDTLEKNVNTQPLYLFSLNSIHLRIYLFYFYLCTEPDSATTTTHADTHNTHTTNTTYHIVKNTLFLLLRKTVLADKNIDIPT